MEGEWALRGAEDSEFGSGKNLYLCHFQSGRLYHPAPLPQAVTFEQGGSRLPVAWQALVFCPNEKARAKILDESSFLSCQVAVGPRSVEALPVPFRYCVDSNPKGVIHSGLRERDQA